MRSRRWILTGTVLGVLVLAVWGSGCGTSTSVLDILADLGITEDMTLSEALDQLTVGDVVAGFVSFANLEAGTLTEQWQAALTDEEQVELESLQAQLTAGDITEDEFDDAVEDLIGDVAPDRPFAGFGFYGSPFGHHANRHRHGIATLDLIDDQQTAADEIFEEAHADIDALRDAAHAEISALLTEDQQTILEAWLNACGVSSSDDASADDEVKATNGEDQLQKSSRFARMHGGWGPGWGGGFGGGFGNGYGSDFGGGSGGGFDGGFANLGMIEPSLIGYGSPRLVDLLDLADEQAGAIDAIRHELREAVQARHEQARDEFLALLTDEQLAELDWLIDDEADG